MHTKCIHDTIVYVKRSSSSETIAVRQKKKNAETHPSIAVVVHSLFFYLSQNILFRSHFSLTPAQDTLALLIKAFFIPFLWNIIIIFVRKIASVVVVNELARHRCGWTTHNISRITGELFARQNWSKQIKKIHTKWKRDEEEKMEWERRECALQNVQCESAMNELCRCCHFFLLEPRCTASLRHWSCIRTGGIMWEPSSGRLGEER